FEAPSTILPTGRSHALQAMPGWTSPPESTGSSSTSAKGPNFGLGPRGWAGSAAATQTPHEAGLGPRQPLRPLTRLGWVRGSHSDPSPNGPPFGGPFGRPWV